MSIYSDVEQVLKDHLANQPYRVQDSEDNELDFETGVDGDGDIFVTVDLSDKDNRIAELEAEVEVLETKTAELEEQIEDLESDLADYRD